MRLAALTCLVMSALFFSTESRAAGPIASRQADRDQIAAAEQRIESSRTNAIESPGQVVTVYFTPKGLPPAANHTARIRRIVQEAADFYGAELTRHGFADRAMSVLRDADNQIRVIDVTGRDANYGKPDGRKIRDEIVPVLRAAGVDPNKSVLLMFCNLMDYDPVKSTISHHSPYYGGGSHLSGNAWQCDSEILDPLRFKDPTPIRDGEYGRITIGRHNSIFIGGVIHELGHALSLPHCRQRDDEAVRGTALMGSGNRTYGQQLRGEGRGTFLTQAHAFRLAAHPVFNRRVTAAIGERPRIEWSDLRVNVTEDNSIRVRGNIRPSLPVHGIIAYFDPAGGGDYDATTATAVPDENDGSFTLESGPLRPGKQGELHLVTCHVNGATSKRSMPYRVDSQGRPDLSNVRVALELEPMIDALRRGELSAAATALQTAAGSDAELRKLGERVLNRFRANRQRPRAASIEPASIDAATQSIPLSQLKPGEASVGWLRPAYDRVPSRDGLLSIDGDYFASGIYAHAPAKHRYEIDRGWKQLAGKCGVQAGSGGKVDFEVVGDGKLLWQARGVTAGAGREFEVDVRGVGTLDLIVTDGGNGTGSDWGVWIEPTLQR